MAHSEPLPYKEENLSGKGVGCVAIQEIAKGSLVLRELPLLFLSEENRNHHAVIKSFLAMSAEDQEEFLKMHNNYEEDSDNWSDAMQNEYQKALPILANFSDISLARASEVWGIYKTNTFTDGVYLKMSRFNHSCRPNADIFGNQDANNSTDLRALRKIRQGEEITICYIDENRSVWSREERRAEMKTFYNFDCNCEGCDMTEEQVQQERETIEAFKERVAQRETVQVMKSMADDDHQERLEWIREELNCVKEMYKLAKTIKPMKRRWVLDNIVDQGFFLACSAAEEEFKLGGLEDSRDDQKKVWKGEAKKFASVGLQIAKTLFGEDNLRTHAWEERGENPMRFYFSNRFNKY